MKKFLILLSLACPSYGKTTTVSRMADIGQFINPAMGLGLTVIKEDEAGLFQCLYSVVLNMAVTAGIKAGVNQIHKGDDPLNKRPNGKPYNFPSGHTSSAAVGAAFIFLRYGIEYAALPFVVTGITAAGRVQSHKHSEAGVMAGLMVGALSAFIFTKKFYEKNKSLTILPVTSKEFNGLKISYRF